MLGWWTSASWRRMSWCCLKTQAFRALAELTRVDEVTIGCSMSTDETMRAYLRHFANKDVAGIASLVAEDVSLRDWNIGEVRGKAEVLRINTEIFNAVGAIEVETKGLYTDGQTAVAEMALTFDQGEPLLVTDVVELDHRGQIKAIRAYKGNA